MHSSIIESTSNGFSVKGSIDFSNVIHLRLAGEKILNACREPQTMVIDLSEMKDHDASAFSLLLCWIRLAQKKQQALSFLNMPTSLRRMQKMFGLNEFEKF